MASPRCFAHPQTRSPIVSLLRQRSRLTRLAWLFLLAAIFLAGGGWMEAADTFSVPFSGIQADFDGYFFFAPLVAGPGNSLLGVTQNGGAQSNGVVFAFAPNGTLTKLYDDFGFHEGIPLGWKPSGIARGADGNYYGTTLYGADTCSSIFKLSTNGTAAGTVVTGLYLTDISDANTGINHDGTNPQNNMIQDAAGAWYGTMFTGGSGNQGTVFKMRTNGTAAGTTYTVLHGFSALNEVGTNSDGAGPRGKLVLDSAGNVYGVVGGGAAHAQGGIFCISAGGQFTLLYSFPALTLDERNFYVNVEGANPFAGLVADGAGSFYGSASAGGAYGQGTFFKLTTNGTAGGTALAVLYSLGKQAGEGAGPIAELTRVSNGVYYSVARGDATNAGIIYKLTTDGTPAGTDYTVVHALSLQGTEGDFVQAPLYLAGDGSLYGTCGLGGFGNNIGTIFKIVPGPSDEFDVPGSANPYLAGLPDGSIAASGDSAPVQSPIRVSGLPITPGSVLTFHATGSVNYGGGDPSDPPDGVQPGQRSGENGISGFNARWNTLVGVFLDDSRPDLTDFPDALDFSETGNVPGGFDYTALTGLKLKQVFFIGDGSTSDGTPQQITVPAGATRLYLGTTDGSGWFNNTGNFHVKVSAGGGGGGTEPLPPVTIAITGATTNGAILHFAANTGAHLAVHLQVSTDGTTWTDLASSNHGAMTEDVNSPGNYKLDTPFYPTGSAVSFRAVAAKSGFADSISPPLGTFNLTQAALSISGQVTTTSDPTLGMVTHIGDDVKYTLTVVNGGSATARNLKLIANVPTYRLSGQTFDVVTGFKFHSVKGNRTLTMMTGDTSLLVIGQHLTGPAFFAGGVNVTGIVNGKKFTVSADPSTTGNFTAPFQDASGNPLVVLDSGDTSFLTVGQKLSGAGFPPGGSTITRILDSTRFTVSVAPFSLGTYSTIFDDDGGAEHQFVATDVTTSATGTFVPATSDTDNNAQVTWLMGDLAPGFQQFVTFTVHVTGKVRENQQLTLPDGQFGVFSDSGQPPGITVSSGSTVNTETTVRGPISFTLTPANTVVAPGGLITYTFTLTNRGAKGVAHAIAAVSTPEATRFDATYPIAGSKSTVPGVAWATKKGGPSFVQNFLASDPGHPQVVIDVGAIPAHGTATFKVTFQAEWISPSEVPRISTVEYAAAFLDTDPFQDPNPANPQHPANVRQYTLFTRAFKDAADTIPQDPGTFDFFSLISDTAHNLAYSKDDSGTFTVPLQGSLDKQPVLHVFKTIGNRAADTESDPDGGSVDFVEPGDELTFLFAIGNTGDSEADDIVLQDGLPDDTTYVTAKLIGESKSTTKSKSTFTGVLDNTGGHHIQIAGITVLPHDVVFVQYTVKVNSGAAAPVVGALLNSDACSVNTSSTPHTTEGLYLNGPIKVAGHAQFAQPQVRLLVPRPKVSTDLSATADAMTAIYKKTPSALPLTDSKNPLSYIPGAQRYYIHYENAGKVAASNVSIQFFLPAHTAFYRASFVDLSANDETGGLGNLPGKLINSPAGTGITPPPGPNKGFLATAGSVVFTFNRMAATAKGDVMVELIVTQDAVQPSGPLLGNPTLELVTIRSGLSPLRAQVDADGSDLNLIDLYKSTLLQGYHPIDASSLVLAPVPNIGVFKTIPQKVQVGSTFDMIITLVNNSDKPAQHPVIEWKIPDSGVELVKSVYGSSTEENTNPGFFHAGAVLDQNVSTNNAPVTTGISELAPHSCAGLTLTYRVTGPAGTTIVEEGTKVLADGTGYVNAPGTSTEITADAPPAQQYTVATGVILNVATVNGSDVVLIDLSDGIVGQGSGNIVAQGGGNIVAQGGGNVVAQGGGNIVAQGGGNLLPIGNLTAKDVLGIVAQGGGNIVVPEGKVVEALAGSKFSAFAAAGGGALVNTNGSNIDPKTGGNLVNTNGSNIVAQGGGNIVAQGGGNIVAQGGGNIVAQGGGNIVAAGGGNIVAQGGGNLVGPSGGTIVAQGGGNITAKAGGNILSSTPNSAAALHSAAGNIYGVGGGNFKPH